MNDELIDNDTLGALPDDPGLAFILFEHACHTMLRLVIEREEKPQ